MSKADHARAIVERILPASISRGKLRTLFRANSGAIIDTNPGRKKMSAAIVFAELYEILPCKNRFNGAKISTKSWNIVLLSVLYLDEFITISPKRVCGLTFEILTITKSPMLTPSTG